MVKGLFSMKKFIALIFLFVLIISVTTACSHKVKQKANLIQSKRRFAEYMEPSSTAKPNTIDLSEGPKLNYDANLGPRSLNFDIKIIDPY